MELGLSLGDATQPFDFLENSNLKQQQHKKRIKNGALDFGMALGLNSCVVGNEEREKARKSLENDEKILEGEGCDNKGETPVQLNLLPLTPVPRRVSSHLQSLPWSSDNGSSENGSSGNIDLQAAKELEANRTLRAVAAGPEEASSANSVGSPFHIYKNNGNGNPLSGIQRDIDSTGNDVVEAERASSRASDDDENGNNRKKLRLSKEQSAFLEVSFKEQNTLNPKQKLALAKQLNLRPRQVEVWFQNRRARTKLKQTEVDFEYLKRCCETLTEENRRLHKELQELRALKNSNAFYMQLPATTLTMCPSCERVATTASSSPAVTASCKNGTTDTTFPKATPFPLNRPIFYPFPQNGTHPNQPATS